MINASELPNEYNWIRKIIYNEVNEQSGTLFVTNQIIEKMLHDESNRLQLRSFSEVSKFLNNNSNAYLKNIIETYLTLDMPNYSAKISLLYAAYLYIIIEGKTECDNYINKIIKRIVSFSSLNITLDHLTFSIFHLATLIAINKYLL